MANSTRINTLDSLRGLAAVTVVVSHACGVLVKGHTLDEFTPLYLFRAAHESVIFFFLLSGYVLTYQVQSQNFFNYSDFMIQRFFRIYILYLIVIVSSIGCFYLFTNSSFTSSESKVVLGGSLKSDVVISHLGLIGNFNTDAYNNVIWSLVHEMRISLIFPILLFVISFRWTKVISITFLLSMIAALGVAFELYSSEGYNNSYLHTVHYFSFFAIGGLIVKHKEQLTGIYLGLKPQMRRYLLLISLLIFCYSRMFFLIPHKYKFYKISLFNEFVSDWMTAIAASFFIISAVNIVNERHFLLNRVPLFLGRISYSLYLIHLPVIIIIFNTFPGANRNILMVFCVVLSVVLASVMNTYVEKPSAKLGKWIVGTESNVYRKKVV